jgi:hypothetical protein
MMFTGRETLSHKRPMRASSVSPGTKNPGASRGISLSSLRGIVHEFLRFAALKEDVAAGINEERNVFDVGGLAKRGDAL